MGRQTRIPKNELPFGVAETAIEHSETRARDEGMQMVAAKQFARRESTAVKEFIAANPRYFVGVSAIGEMAAFAWTKEQYLGEELTILSVRYVWPERELAMEAEFLQGGGFNELALLDYGVEINSANIHEDRSLRARNARGLLAVVGESLYLSDVTCVITEHGITVGYTPFSSAHEGEAAEADGPGMYVKRANIGGNRYLFAPFEVMPKG